MVKNPPANAGDARDVGLISGWGRSPGEGHGNALQYSCLENPVDIGAWWPIEDICICVSVCIYVYGVGCDKYISAFLQMYLEENI